MRNKSKILILEDDPTLGFIYTQIFKKASPFLDLKLCMNGLEAMSYIKNEIEKDNKLPDAILSDLHMPIVDGWGFMDRFREFLWLNDIMKRPLIWLSSSDNTPEVIYRANQHSMIDKFVAKPFQIENVNEFLKIYKHEVA